MPYTTPDGSGDFEKLQQAFGEIWATFGSVDNLLEAFGLTDLPVAQRYGILVGCIVFMVTVMAVLSLLVLGGSFRRIAEQTQTGSITIPADYRARLGRPLLLEHLLDARARMLQRNYPNRATRTEGRTNLTQMLLTAAPPPEGTSEAKDKTGYMKNYVVAYRKCQDKPGGRFKKEAIPLQGTSSLHSNNYSLQVACCRDDQRHASRPFREPMLDVGILPTDLIEDPMHACTNKCAVNLTNRMMNMVNSSRKIQKQSLESLLGWKDWMSSAT